MRQSIDQLRAEGWSIQDVPLTTAISPDGRTVAAKCMTCSQVIKGVMVETSGLVRCNRCNEEGLKNIAINMTARGIVEGVAALIRKIKL